MRNIETSRASRVRRAEVRDRLGGSVPVPPLMKSMFDKMMHARKTDARHVNYTAGEWDRLGNLEPEHLSFQQNLIKIARRHVVVIEVGGVPLRCQEPTQKQIDYLNKIITE